MTGILSWQTFAKRIAVVSPLESVHLRVWFVPNRHRNEEVPWVQGGLRAPQAGNGHLPVMLPQVLAAFEWYVSSEVDVVGRLELSRMHVAIE